MEKQVSSETETYIKQCFHEEFPSEYFQAILKKFKDKSVRDSMEAHLPEYMWMAYCHGYQEAGGKIRIGK